MMEAGACGGRSFFMADRKQRGRECLPGAGFLLLPFYSTRSPAYGMVLPTFRVGFLPFNNPLWKCLIDIPRIVLYKSSRCF
jgi:hypothetical protein